MDNYIERLESVIELLDRKIEHSSAFIVDEDCKEYSFHKEVIEQCMLVRKRFSIEAMNTLIGIKDEAFNELIRDSFSIVPQTIAKKQESSISEDQEATLELLQDIMKTYFTDEEYYRIMAFAEKAI